MKKILVVDDDPAILDALEITFLDAGYKVKTNVLGNKTIELAKSYKPHIILLDILISGTDGREVAKSLKSDTETNHIPIIMLSAHPSITTIIQDAGVNDFIAKPFDINELLLLIEKYTKK